MPVFDFSNVSNTEKEAECTYITFPSNEPEATPEMPILILDNQKQKWPHHSCGFLPILIKGLPLNFRKRKEIQQEIFFRWIPDL